MPKTLFGATIGVTFEALELLPQGVQAHLPLLSTSKAAESASASFTELLSCSCSTSRLRNLGHS